MQTTATPAVPTARPTTSSSTVPSGFASSRGASASTSSSSSTAGARRVASATASRSAAAAADASSAPMPGAQRRTTVAPTAAATARTRVVFPDPAGPVTSTPSCGVVPSRASTSVWWKPRSSHSRSWAACACMPGRSSRLGTGSAAPSVPPPPASGDARPCVALPVVLPPSRQPTTLPMVTSAGPAGSVPVTVSSVVVQARPIAVDRLRRVDAASRSAPGAASCGSSETLSPAVTTLPSSACRSIPGGTATIASAGPGDDHPARLAQRRRRDRHRVAVADPEVAQQQVVAEQVAAGAVRPGDGDHRAGGPAAGQPDRVPLGQAERREHLAVHPDHAAARVQPRGRQPGGQRQVAPVGRRVGHATGV